MAENKKSFLLYADLLHMVEKLPDEIAGKLFKIILEYVNDKNPITDDILLQIAFEPVKQQLKRDLKRWEDFRHKQSENGKLGGRPKKEETQEKPNNPSLISESQKSLSVNANVNVNANGSVNKQKLTPPTKLDAEKFFIGVGGTREQGEDFWLYYQGKIGFDTVNDWTALAQKWFLGDAKKNKKEKTW